MAKIKTAAEAGLDVRKKLRQVWRVGEFTPDNIPTSAVHRYNADVLESIKANRPTLFVEAVKTRLWDAEKHYLNAFLPWMRSSQS